VSAPDSPLPLDAGAEPTAVSTAEPRNSAPQPQEPRHPARFPHFAHMLDAIASLFSMVVIALFVLMFIVQPFRIPSASMEPALLVGDFLLVNKIVNTAPPPAASLLPRREIGCGDIIVFRYPPDPNIHVVKRVIGVPGDRIHLRNGVVYVNGQPLREPYVVGQSGRPDPFRDQFPVGVDGDPRVDPRWRMQLRAGLGNGEYVVPPNSYFVLGDNRDDSRDSRYWGVVPRENIVGSPFLIYFSLRQDSLEDVSTLPDDKLDQRKDDAYSVMDFARWDRIFRIVR
jgi:signal peptidase I